VLETRQLCRENVVLTAVLDKIMDALEGIEEAFYFLCDMIRLFCGIGFFILLGRMKAQRTLVPCRWPPSYPRFTVSLLLGCIARSAILLGALVWALGAISTWGLLFRILAYVLLPALWSVPAIHSLLLACVSFIQRMDARGPGGVDGKLLQACDEGDVQRVIRTLDSGADPNARYSDSPFSLASESGTALMRAAGNGHIDVVKVLLDRGADVRARESWTYETALHRAALGDYVEVAKVLLDAGLDINTRDKRSGTPIHAALRHLRRDMIRFLVEAGADVNAKDDAGFAPLDTALLYKSNDIPMLLKEHGARTNRINEEELGSVEGFRPHLRRKATAGEIENGFTIVEGPWWWKTEVTYGPDDERWRELASQMQDGDEIWLYSSPKEAWNMLMGWEGFLLIRGNKVIDSYMTAMN